MLTGLPGEKTKTSTTCLAARGAGIAIGRIQGQRGEIYDVSALTGEAQQGTT
ncbi:MAG: hypothetical protein RBT80_06105 [Candidatus Vecturithrix sp.]|nr:hypothetical protein [Candidatus Vecturithrix sp.]